MKELKLSVILLLFLFCCTSLFSAEKYAVIISTYAVDHPDVGSTEFEYGRDDTTRTSDEFWCDLFLAWDTLKEKNFSDENIFAFYGYGIDYNASYIEIDGRYYPGPEVTLTDFPANRDTIIYVLESLANGTNGFPEIQDDDFLYVFVFGHGSYTYGIDTEYHTFMHFQGYTYDPTHQIWDEDHAIADFEFGTLIDSINASKKVINLGQCYSGGFIDYLQDENSIIFYNAPQNSDSCIM